MVIKGSGKPSKGLSYVVATFSEFLDAVRKLNEFCLTEEDRRLQPTRLYLFVSAEQKVFRQMVPYSEGIGKCIIAGIEIF